MAPLAWTLFCGLALFGGCLCVLYGGGFSRRSAEQKRGDSLKRYTHRADWDVYSFAGQLFGINPRGEVVTWPPEDRTRCQVSAAECAAILGIHARATAAARRKAEARRARWQAQSETAQRARQEAEWARARGERERAELAAQERIRQRDRDPVAHFYRWLRRE